MDEMSKKEWAKERVNNFFNDYFFLITSSFPEFAIERLLIEPKVSVKEIGNDSDFYDKILREFIGKKKKKIKTKYNYLFSNLHNKLPNSNFIENLILEAEEFLLWVFEEHYYFKQYNIDTNISNVRVELFPYSQYSSTFLLYPDKSKIAIYLDKQKLRKSPYIHNLLITFFDYKSGLKTSGAVYLHYPIIKLNYTSILFFLKVYFSVDLLSVL